MCTRRVPAESAGASANADEALASKVAIFMEVNQRESMVMQAAASSTPRNPPPFSAIATRAPSTCRDPLRRANATRVHKSARDLSPRWGAPSIRGSRRINRYPPAQCRGSTFRQPPPLPRLAQAQILCLHDLSEGGGVMHLCDGYVIRSDSRCLVSLTCRDTTHMTIHLIDRARGASGQDARVHSDGAAPIEAMQGVFAHEDRAAAPSLIGAHIGKVRGHVMARAASTSSMLKGVRYCANGFRVE